MSLSYTAQEWQALAAKWGSMPEHERSLLEKQMSRQQLRAHSRRLEKLNEDKLKYGRVHVTRKDVVELLGLYIDRHLLPFGGRVDNLERAMETLWKTQQYLALPFYRRWWVDLMALWVRLVKWLAERGIHIVTLEEQDGTGNGIADGGVQPPGEERHGAEGGAASADGEALAVGLHGDDRGPDLRAGGDPAEAAGPGQGAAAGSGGAVGQGGGRAGEGIVVVRR